MGAMVGRPSHDGENGEPSEGGATLSNEYARLLAVEERRRQRRDKLQDLLPTIADALDVRTVFPRMSDVIQDVIPHVTVSLALLTPDGLGVKLHVASNYDVGELPAYRFTTPGEQIQGLLALVSRL